MIAKLKYLFLLFVAFNGFVINIIGLDLLLFDVFFILSIINVVVKNGIRMKLQNSIYPILIFHLYLLVNAIFISHMNQGEFVLDGSPENFYIENFNIVSFDFGVLFRTRYLIFILLFLSISQISNYYSFEAILRFVKYGLSVSLIYAFLEFFSMIIWGEFVFDKLFFTLDDDLFMISENHSFLKYNLPKLNSLTQEPGHFAIYLCILIMLSSFYRNKLVVIFSIIFLFLSGSLNGIFGLFLIVVSRIFNRFKNKFLLFAFLLISFLVVYYNFDFFLGTKFNSDIGGSGFVRLFSVITSFELYKSHILFGVGFPLVTSHDVIVFLLSNTGLIGLALFLYFLFFYRNFVFGKLIFMFFAISVFSGFYYYFPLYLVLVFGLTIEIDFITNGKNIDNSNPNV